LYSDNSHVGLYGGGDASRGELPNVVSWSIFDTIGQKFKNYQGSTTNNNIITYIGSTIIEASGSEDGKSGFMRVVEIPISYVSPNDVVGRMVGLL